MYKLSCINEHLLCASDIKFVLHVTVNDIGLESIIYVILKEALKRSELCEEASGENTLRCTHKTFRIQW